MGEPKNDHIHDSEAWGAHGGLEPKHKIFLSHSGAQKGFVEQLCVDLERCDRYSFFDKRQDSLPIGEHFPNQIFEAIRQCQVGVVVLSEEFFTRSKWPMLELVAMVECQKQNSYQMKIVPIFLGISCEDLGNEGNHGRWVLKWELWAQFDSRIDIEEWVAALKLLRSINGLSYNHAIGEVKFREDIVQEISKVVPPLSKCDDSHVQGRVRFCKVINDKIVSTKVSRTYGVKVLGIYGVGGIGKSTLCKALCNEFLIEMIGRVCHVELGNGKEMELLQNVLIKLTDTSPKLLKELSIDECRVRLKNNMQKRRVFLAIDNVTDNLKAIEETQRYLQVGYEHGSIVLVTARSLGVLQNLKIDDWDSLEMPDLEEGEAKALFSHYVGRTVFELDGEVLMQCIKRCYFGKGNGSKCHFHPLALKVLAMQLGVNDPKEWDLKLNEGDTFNQLREREHPVFSILRGSFDALLVEDQHLFMDAALFDPKIHSFEWTFQNWRSMNMFEWLSMVHGISVNQVMKRLGDLKRKSVVEDLGDGSTRIGMHDLWREFCVMETKVGESKCWLYEELDGRAQDSRLCGGGWENLQRICLAGRNSSSLSAKVLTLSSCSNVTVLKLQVGASTENQTLDLDPLNLAPMKHLKSLEILQYRIMGHERGIKVTGIGLLRNLLVLILFSIDVHSSVLEEISCLAYLQVLHLTWTHEIMPAKTILLDLGQMSFLQEAIIKGARSITTLRLSSKMTNLRILKLECCRGLRGCPGVGDVLGLEVLELYFCRDFEEMPNLQKLTNLRTLVIRGCKLLNSLLGLRSLVALEELQARGCNNLAELQDMSKLTNLQVLNLRYCDSLTHIPGLCSLVALRKISARVQLLRDWPDWQKLTKLHSAQIFGENARALPQSVVDKSRGKQLPQGLPRVVNLANLECLSTLEITGVHDELANLMMLTRLEDLRLYECGFKDVPGLSNLTALKSLEFNACSNLERFPDMRKLTRLEMLLIWCCHGLRGWDGVGTLKPSESLGETNLDSSDCSLPHLEKLSCNELPIFELPDLNYFPRLRELDLLRCDALLGLSRTDAHPQLESLHCESLGITEIPDLRSFPRLKKISVEGCRGLSRLTCSGPAPQLHIIMCRYSSIQELPDLSNFPRLKELDVYECHLTSLTNSGSLSALEVLSLSECRSLKRLPDFSLCPGLRKVRLWDCGVELNVPEAEKLRGRCSRLELVCPWRSAIPDESLCDAPSEPAADTANEQISDRRGRIMRLCGTLLRVVDKRS